MSKHHTSRHQAGTRTYIIDKSSKTVEFLQMVVVR